MSSAKSGKQTTAQLLIRSLVRQNVKHIFGISEGKIMPTFDVLRDEGPHLVLRRHEAERGVYGRGCGTLTGRPGSLSCHFWARGLESCDGRSHRHNRRRPHGGDWRGRFLAGHAHAA
jgi:hypothetical protein